MSSQPPMGCHLAILQNGILYEQPTSYERPLGHSPKWYSLYKWTSYEQGSLWGAHSRHWQLGVFANFDNVYQAATRSFLIRSFQNLSFAAINIITMTSQIFSKIDAYTAEISHSQKVTYFERGVTVFASRHSFLYEEIPIFHMSVHPEFSRYGPEINYNF